VLRWFRPPWNKTFQDGLFAIRAAMGESAAGRSWVRFRPKCRKKNIVSKTKGFLVLRASQSGSSLAGLPDAIHIFKPKIPIWVIF
jgi:hypothetical protein